MGKWSGRRKLVLGVAVLVALLALLSAFLVTRPQPVQPQVVAISEILNRAEQHQIKDARVSGDLVVITDVNGQQYQAAKEPQQPVSEILRRDGVSVEVSSPDQANWPGLALAAVPFLLVAGLVLFVSRGGGVNSQQFAFGRSRARVSDVGRPSVTFADVAGVEEAKIELNELVQFLKDPQRFTEVGARVPRGVLLVGPPGTGKTLISKAVAGEAGVPFFSISGSEFVEMFVGVGASRVRDLFRMAKRNAPCIVFIDEIDAVGRHRGAGVGGGNDEREQTLNQLLVEMDGFDSQTNVVVIAATNRPDILDRALLRPGRFDRRVTLDPPDIVGRQHILAVHSRDKRLAPEVTLDKIAQQTPGFSGADLANLMNEAAILTARDGRTAISMKDIEEALLRVVAGPERKSRVITEQEKSVVAYHEVGHAIVMRTVSNGDPVHKVSVVSRGQALGITVQMPKEDRYLLTSTQLKAKMAAAMGGFAAEEIIFDDVTTGARQDIHQATEIATRMVCEFGMGGVGTVAFRRSDEHGREQSLSESVATKVDEAVLSLVDESYRTAREILLDKRDRLVAIAEHLREVETMSGDELDEMLQRPHVAVDW
ncbi:MAG: ATP-dependent zinc metalloprotease FtsH [Chloroflexi bacterium]|nr:ATP-dependent zinc metalloprotease FtsH [Chloroflexota bacterium]MCL5107501.1 ATP-dependent zinc metalloprotease FtsH [Chloroflexota bacterium]